MLMCNDDNIVRIVPTFPSSNFKKVFELKGHKNSVIGMNDYFNLHNKLITIDKNGMLLCWELVKAD